MKDIKITGDSKVLKEIREALYAEDPEIGLDLTEINQTVSGEMGEPILDALILALGLPSVSLALASVLNRWMTHREKMEELKLARFSVLGHDIKKELDADEILEYLIPADHNVTITSEPKEKMGVKLFEIPVIYLAFANDDDAHLSHLKAESRDINNILSPLHDKKIIEIYRDESTAVGDLIDSIIRFDNKLGIFHYAGHAGGTSLNLEGGRAGAEGLAGLLARLKNLQLVFLNGCSTYDQVNYLIELGVKAIIATTVSINDEKAKEFSSMFYKALAAGNTIKESFEIAASGYKTQYSEYVKPVVIEIRGGFELDEGSELPWGLYYKYDNNEVLEWKLKDIPI